MAAAGFFYRTLRMIDNDLKPCYVFDGKPPDLKSNVVRLELSATVVALRKLTFALSPTVNSSRSVSPGAKQPRRARRRPRRPVGRDHLCAESAC